MDWVWNPGKSGVERSLGLIPTPLLYWGRAWGLSETRPASLFLKTSISSTWGYIFKYSAQYPPQRLQVWDTRVKEVVTKIDQICGNHVFMPLLSPTIVLPAHAPWVAQVSPFHSPYLLLPMWFISGSTLSLFSHPLALGPLSSAGLPTIPLCLSPPHCCPSLLSLPDSSILGSSLFVNFKANMMK